MIVLTPSPDTGHGIAAFVLLGFVFGWYAIRLYRVDSPWLLLHLSVPLLVLIATRASSYGVWQKLIVVYFLFAANIDCLLATGRLNLPGPDAFERKRRRGVRRECAPRVIWRRTDQPPTRRRGA